MKLSSIPKQQLLIMALVGLETERRQVMDKITTIRKSMGLARSAAPVEEEEPEKETKRRTFSAATRRKMAISQRKRWRLKKAA